MHRLFLNQKSYQEPDGWRFYLGNTGEPIRDAWYLDTDGKWYWFNAAGIMVTSTWYKYKGEWYYLGADRAMAKAYRSPAASGTILIKTGRWQWSR
uniref:hypothetical protein n=1 Tax=Clostridium sp. NkU-1 TaxID=1095009 RepID=UPI0032611E0D